MAICLTGLGFTTNALAAFGCYDTDLYPVVFRLTEDHDHLQAALGPKPGQPPQPDMQINQRAVQDGNGGWRLQDQLCSSGGCRDLAAVDTACARNVPMPTLSFEELKKLSPKIAGYMEKLGACVERDGIVWFGITFYCGEGSCGLGGIGRYDTRTGKLEVRRPKPLLEGSVSPLLFDGKYLWVGTFSSSECIGDDPVSGLVRYDWATDTAASFGGGTDSGGDPGGPCGFRFNDLYVDKQGLWAASDMGLALLTNPQDAPAAMHWSNYVPDRSDPQSPMTAVSCKDLYGRLLKSLPHKDWNGASEFDGHREQFSAFLRRFNPALAAELEN
jgi:hypothetical protein